MRGKGGTTRSSRVSVHFERREVRAVLLEDAAHDGAEEPLDEPHHVLEARDAISGSSIQNSVRCFRVLLRSARKAGPRQ